MRVLIIGGGIGGLALASGLRRRGIDTAVFERDTDLAATGGYHLHLNAHARAALGTLLTPDDLERVYSASATGRLQGGDIVRDMRGRVLAEAKEAGQDGSVNIDRISLRLILADAVGDSLHTGRTFTGFERNDDGTVTAVFDDGGTETGDVLVGADGVGSAIAAELAGGPTSAPLGLIGIGGRTRLGRLPAEIDRMLARRSGLAIGPYGTGLYIGYHDPIGQPALRTAHPSTAATTEPTYIWGAVLPESAESGALRGLRRAELRDATIRLLRSKTWSTRMLEVVRHSDTAQIDVFRFHASSADPSGIAPWPAGCVTALGDGVHAMPPTAGMGAATAIRDAALLATQLGRAADAQHTVPIAVHEYEQGMREYAAEAVAASLKPIGWIRASSGPVGAGIARLALPALAGFASLGRRRAGGAAPSRDAAVQAPGGSPSAARPA